VPEALPDNVIDTPAIGPPSADVTLTTIATGNGQGGITQSGCVEPHAATVAAKAAIDGKRRVTALIEGSREIEQHSESGAHGVPCHL
jgi:hypothetical protein